MPQLSEGLADLDVHDCSLTELAVDGGHLPECVLSSKVDSGQLDFLPES